jgi:hypothetical protein
MGNTYFYGKIVSAFGTDLLKGKGGMKNIMSYMMMSEMMKGNSGSNNGGLSAVLPLMMLNGGGSMPNIFDGMFDFDDNDTEDENETTDTEVTE